MLHRAAAGYLRYSVFVPNLPGGVSAPCPALIYSGGSGPETLNPPEEKLKCTNTKIIRRLTFEESRIMTNILLSRDMARSHRIMLPYPGILRTPAAEKKTVILGAAS
jgi:hypothetical protein